MVDFLDRGIFTKWVRGWEANLLFERLKAREIESEMNHSLNFVVRSLIIKSNNCG